MHIDVVPRLHLGPRSAPQRRGGRARRAATTSSPAGRPPSSAGARYLVSDGARSDAPPRPGYRLIARKARMLGGAVTRLYERD